MSTAYSTRIARIRVSLNEATEQEWLDATIASEISLAERWFAEWLGRKKRGGYFQNQETFTLAADATSHALSSFAKDLVSVDNIEMSVAGAWVPVGEIPDGQEWTYRNVNQASSSGAFVPHYLLRDPNLVFVPASTSARSMRVLYRWVPAEKTESGTLETPARFDDVIDKRVLFVLLSDEGEREGTFEDYYSARLSEVTQFVVGRQGTSVGEVVKSMPGGAFGTL